MPDCLLHNKGRGKSSKDRLEGLSKKEGCSKTQNTGQLDNATCGLGATLCNRSSPIAESNLPCCAAFLTLFVVAVGQAVAEGYVDCKLEQEPLVGYKHAASIRDVSQLSQFQAWTGRQTLGQAQNCQDQSQQRLLSAKEISTAPATAARPSWACICDTRIKQH